MSNDPGSDVQAQALVDRIKADRERLRAMKERFQLGQPTRVILALMFAALFVGALLWEKEPFNPALYIGGAFGTAVAGYFVTWMFSGYSNLFFGVFEKQHESYLATAGKDKLQESLEEDFFTKLVKINFKYIDQYYLETQSQANKSFTITLTVACIAAAVIVAGVVMLFIGKDVTAASLTAGAGVLSEFIAAIFFYLYNRTVLKMGHYHQKLVITQNIGLAMKLAEELPEPDRTEVRKELARRLTEDVNKHLTDSMPEAESTKAKEK